MLDPMVSDRVPSSCGSGSSSRSRDHAAATSSTQDACSSLVPRRRLSTPLIPEDPLSALGAFDPNPNMSMALVFAWDAIPVFPVWPILTDGSCGCRRMNCGSPGKHPMGHLVPAGFKNATCDLSQIVAWWTTNPAPNVAIPTGASSGLVVLDIDPKANGLESFERLTATHGQLPATWTVATGGGGRHFYLRHPGVLIKTTAGELGSGLDIRGDGGYVVTPPSLHRSGLSYSWSQAGRPDEIDLADFPSWLMILVSRPVNLNSALPDNGTDAEVIVEGQRNYTLTRIAGAMRRYGCAPEAIGVALCEDNARRCRPPLPENEVLRIARSIGSPRSTLPPLTRRGASTRGFVPFGFRGGKVSSV
jgi:hypothetical protein